jgi:hypothetical protein
MKTFKGKPEIKDKLVERAVEHRKADRIVQGYGYFNTSLVVGEEQPRPVGCAIGCLATPLTRLSAVGGANGAVRKLGQGFGLCETLVRACEAVFETNWNGGYATRESIRKASRWPTRFAKAVPVGVDITNADVAAFLERSPAFVFDPDYPTDVTTAFGVRGRDAANALVRWLKARS